MSLDNSEIKRREEAALAEINRVFGTEVDEYGATLFVSHHLEEIDASYWQKHLNTSRPEPRQVIDILQLRSHWGDEDDDGIDIFDFTLPDYVVNYVISVRFDEWGRVVDISMES